MWESGHRWALALALDQEAGTMDDMETGDTIFSSGYSVRWPYSDFCPCMRACEYVCMNLVRPMQAQNVS